MFDQKLTHRAQKIVQICTDKNITISCAESCTGGMLSALITSIPGSSKIFMGGVACYSNESKINLLKVKQETIKTQGTVSRQTCEQMAKNTREIFDTSIAIAITGIAGPASDNTQKPVGLVYIGYSSNKNQLCKEYRFLDQYKAQNLSNTKIEDQIGDQIRDQIRLFTLEESILMIENFLSALPL